MKTATKLPQRRLGGTAFATAEIEKMVGEWRETKRRRKAEELLEGAQAAALKLFLGDRTALMDMTGTKALATYAPHEVLEFDSARFAEDRPKLYAQYVRAITRRPLLAK